MGVARWPQIAERLVAGGLPPDTPAAAVRWGTRSEQHSIRATLATLADHPLEAPSVIVVGAVAGLDLRWFEDRPLLGRRVVVTRTRAQASELSAALWELGAEAVEVPVIEIGPPSDDGAALAAAVTSLAPGDWLVFTSPNGVERTFALIPDTRALGGVQVAAIGPGTAAALARHAVVADLVPERYVAEGLLDAFPDPPHQAEMTRRQLLTDFAEAAEEADGAGVDVSGRVVIARAEEAREVLPEGLAERGWHVEVVPAYRTQPVVPADDTRAAVAAADAVTFTSSSTVRSFVDAFGRDAVPPVVACIGPVTAATARELGLDVTVEADPHTIPGLVAALRTALAPPAS